MTRIIRTVEWLPASTAPAGEVLLLWGNGPVRLGMLDALGNWRAKHGGPFKTPPKFWMPIPDGPSEEELAPVAAVGARLLPIRPLLTEQQIADIRGQHARGEDQARIAAQFNVTPRTIEAIVRGKPWRRLATEEPVGDLLDRRAVGKGP